MKILYLLALLAVLSLSQDLNLMRPTISEAQQPFSGTFAATWLGGFCFQSSRCDRENLDKWDRESFTIHGLWPNARTQKTFGEFDVNNIIKNVPLYNNLRNFWPPQSNSDKSEYWLWGWEYNKHGVDYADILQTYSPEKFQGASDQTLQQTYFQAGLRFYHLQRLEKIDLAAAEEPVNFNSYGDLLVTKTQLGQIIGLKVEHFVTNCKKGTNVLEEIQICFRIGQDFEFAYEECEDIKNSGETPYPLADNCESDDNTIKMIKYKNADAPRQEQVTRFTPLQQNDENL